MAHLALLTLIALFEVQQAQSDVQKAQKSERSQPALVLAAEKGQDEKVRALLKTGPQTPVGSTVRAFASGPRNGHRGREYPRLPP